MADKVLRSHDIENITGYTSRRIRDLEAAGNFPKRFLINPEGRSVGWLESEVQRWIESRAATREAAR